MKGVARSLPHVSRIPIVLVYALCMCYYYFGWTFYSAFTILFSVSIINYFIAKVSARRSKVCLKKKDKRLDMMAEVINNIKVIKLNSWIPRFLDEVQHRRAIEMKAIVKSFMVQMISMFVGYLTPMLVVVVVFAVMMAHGYHIGVSNAYAAMNVIWMLQGPMNWLPYFIGMIMEFKVSLTRIEKYLLCPEVNSELVS